MWTHASHYKENKTSERSADTPDTWDLFVSAITPWLCQEMTVVRGLPLRISVAFCDKLFDTTQQFFFFMLPLTCLVLQKKGLLTLMMFLVWLYVFWLPTNHSCSGSAIEDFSHLLWQTVLNTVTCALTERHFSWNCHCVLIRDTAEKKKYQEVRPRLFSLRMLQWLFTDTEAYLSSQILFWAAF